MGAMTQHQGSSAAEAAAALDPRARGVLRVRGGPGTGKTSLLVEAAAAHVAAGADANSLLLLTGSGRLPAAARGSLTATVLAAGGPTSARAVREPLVRTVHGYAFGVLQRAARRAEAAPPRLVTGAEQDSVIRELLAGDGARAWPPSLHAALATDGFATELRDLMARCAERGVDPAELVRLGKRCRRPEWAAAGRFARQYEQVMLLRAAVGTAAPQATTPALGAAELVGAALEAFAADRDLLVEERSRIRLLLVDDAQQLDPQAARLVRVLAAGVQRTVIAGDPDQAVFGFRGAEPAALLADETGATATPALTLTASHRCAPAVAHAISAIAARLPGPGTGRRLTGSGADDGSVTVRAAASGHAEAASIADTLRRAHLVDGVPWSQMAVIVRSVPRAAARLPRTLAAAGIPVTLPAPGGLLAEQPAVAALLTVLDCAVEGVDGLRALALLTGPIGRMDPVSLRQLQRILRRGGAARPETDAGDRLAALLSGGSGELPAVHARPLRRVRAVLQAAARSHADGRDPHYTLWQAWNRSGLQQRWLSAAERGGPAGAQAGRDLDAVTALFDLAEQYAARTAGATLTGLVEHVSAMQLVMPRAEPAVGVEAVGVLSAHAALGREWELVVIAGVQEGLWPNTVPRGGVLGTQRLLDTLHGLGDDVSARAPVLAEERRLLVAAMGRARRRLMITAVDGEADAGGAEVQIPSEFFTELAACATSDGDRAPAPPVVAPPVLSAAGLVGRLRAVVCAPAGTVTDSERDDAATQLARLARAGVPGADPAGWHGTAPVSTEEPLRPADDGQLVTLSPSALQSLLDCPLRWLAERHGGTDGRDLRSTIGSVMHALVAESAGTAEELLAELDRAWRQLPFESPWYSANEHDRHRAMIEAFLAWRAQTRDQLTEVGTEVAFDGVIPAGDGVRLRGRIDRIERDAAGRLVVVDVKTAKSPVSKDDAQQHAQLAVYQLAVQAGLLGPDEQPGGARLVYPAKPGTGGAAEREQDPLTTETGGQWRERIAQAAAATAGPVFTARVNDGCRHCPIRPICPAHTGGSGA
ncbi:DNA helicase [Mycolicibacter terrae]|uniref:DNA 3'-5' helicase n=4 Tax=Mycolicibacter terrae TaxID=1788 RepID=A0AAD1HVR3_9MYCO|nr:DNA helicase [Mycolicibacter terrae]SNV85540.1 ATP-dependent DNA helicase [Mycolicibacter terrae]